MNNLPDFCDENCQGFYKGWCRAFPGKMFVNVEALAGCPKLGRVTLLYTEDKVKVRAHE
jgi:hypothetical protein